MLITLLILVFAVQKRINCISLKTTQRLKDIELVNLLKQDLRRNNDDYIEKFNNSKTAPIVHNKQSGAENVAKTNAKDQVDINFQNKPNQMFLETEAKRRNIEYSEEVNYNKYSFSPATATDPKRFHKVLISAEPSRFTTSSTSLSKLKKQDRLNLFKQFIDRNRDLIQDFVKKKRGEATTEPMPTLEPSEEERVSPRAKSSEERRATPEPRQLDMSPAKGGRIHSLRIKGRLCQRHVLVPEGPKYDSKGLVYLPPFARRVRDYPQTRPPKLLLPKCCNCCKKSVLGCE